MSASVSIDTSESWLIQRLQKAPEATEKGDFLALAAQAFGGGSLGLSAEARALLRQVVSFEYMGAAEFEFGIIPETLGRIAKEHADFIAYSFVLSASDIKPSYWRTSLADDARRAVLAAAKKAGKRAPRKKAAPPITPLPGDTTFYVLCHKNMRASSYVEALVKNCAAGTQRTKLGDGLQRALDPDPSHAFYNPTIGWFELHHGFFYFTNKDAWTRMCSLFSVPVSEAP